MNERPAVLSAPTLLVEAGPEAPPEWELAARCGFSLTLWRHLEARARSLGCDPFDLAIGDGVVTERDFVAALATLIETPFLPAPPVPQAPPPSEEAMAFRSYPAQGEDGGKLRVLAPNGALAALLIRQHREGKHPRLVLTTRQALLDRLVEADGARIARNAAFGLPEGFSARHAGASAPKHRAIWLTGALVFALFLALAAFFPVPALVLPPLLIAPLFILAGISVLTATFESGAREAPHPPVETAHLPRYSLLVPLFREANIAEELVKRLDALIYPRDRLEAFLLVEADDTETQAALRQTKLPAWMLILTVPPGDPRTKPRALNAALPFATGDLLVVYDAEDAPEGDQLLRAAALFHGSTPDVACLQARLAITNVRDGFLSRRFAIDYAALFDCIKAGMGRAEWPVPLGGSSNHFRTAVLRQVGGWDAWNVTEDADLGLRLARFGWRVADLRSTTWEEAPNTFAAWMNQRTRWMKGWLQTLIVHARQPRLLYENIGLFRMVVIASTGIGVLLGALLYPVFIVAVTIRLMHPAPLGGGSPLLTAGDAMLVLALVVAVLVEFIPAIAALRRRKALALAPYILAAPVTHLLVSVATWRALVELIRRPFHWHKTMHGQARNEGGLSPIGDPVRSRATRPPK